MPYNMNSECKIIKLNTDDYLREFLNCFSKVNYDKMNKTVIDYVEKYSIDLVASQMSNPMSEFFFIKNNIPFAFKIYEYDPSNVLKSIDDIWVFILGEVHEDFRISFNYSRDLIYTTAPENILLFLVKNIDIMKSYIGYKGSKQYYFLLSDLPKIKFV